MSFDVDFDFDFLSLQRNRIVKSDSGNKTSGRRGVLTDLRPHVMRRRPPFEWDPAITVAHGHRSALDNFQKVVEQQVRLKLGVASLVRLEGDDLGAFRLLGDEDRVEAHIGADIEEDAAMPPSDFIEEKINLVAFNQTVGDHHTIGPVGKIDDKMRAVPLDDSISVARLQ